MFAHQLFKVRLKLICFTLLVFVQTAYSQEYVTTEFYKPEEVVYEHPVLERILKDSEQDKEVLQNYRGKAKKRLKENIENRNDFLLDLASRGYFYKESPILDYIKELVGVIVAANPEIERNYTVLLSRSNDINAYTISNGIVVVNLGLIHHLNSVDEVAFVIAHELAHDVRNHSINKMIDHVEAQLDPEREKEIKNILKGEYRVYSQLKEFILPGLMATMQHARDKEFEADSLGVLFAMKAGFSIQGAQECLRTFDLLDDTLYSNHQNWESYATQHQCSIYPYWEADFNKSSLGSFDISKEYDEKKFQTHPDCIDRIEALKNLPTIDVKSSNITLAEAFNSVKYLTQFEIIESGLSCNNYSSALYYAVQGSVHDTSSHYLRGLQGYMLARIAYQKSVLRGGEFLEYPMPEVHPKDYHDFLRVLWELTSDELVCLATDIWSKEAHQFPEHWNIAFKAYCAYSDGKKDEADRLAAEYQIKYGAERFSDSMKNLLNRQ